MNVAEYSIQLIHKKYLKNLPVEMTLEQPEEHLVQQLRKKERSDERRANQECD